MSIYKQLFEAKKEIGKISKDSTNPFFKSKYFDVNSLLEHVEPILEKHGLLLLQPIREGRVCTQIICVECEDEETYIVESSITLPNIQDAQKLGSAITYYRRYTLQSLLGLQAEDDDGNKAVKPVKIDYTRQKTALKACVTKDDLKKFWEALAPIEKTALTKLKDEFKLKLTK